MMRKLGIVIVSALCLSSVGRAEDYKAYQNYDFVAGDRILFGKYSGSDTTLDGTEYIIMREDDVLGVLDGARRSKKAS